MNKKKEYQSNTPETSQSRKAKGNVKKRLYNFQGLNEQS